MPCVKPKWLNIRYCWDIHPAASLQVEAVVAAAVVVVPILTFPLAEPLLKLDAAAACTGVVRGLDCCSAVADTLPLRLPLLLLVSSLRGPQACRAWVDNSDRCASTHCSGYDAAAVIVEDVEDVEIARVGVAAAAAAAAVVVGDAERARTGDGGRREGIVVVVVAAAPTFD